MIIKTSPITFPMVNVSPNNHTPNRKTIAGAKLMKGYASVIWNLVIAIDQHTEAMNADKKPEKIKGSNKNLVYEITISHNPDDGIDQFIFIILHLRIICP